MKQSFIIHDNRIFINGEQIDPPKSLGSAGLDVTQCDGKLYVNGFERVDGKWKRTLAAIWHYIF